MTPPIITLVNTQMPENIGAAARAMMNFGLTQLRLVKPREAWPNTRAYDLAGHAASILDNAMLYETTREAVADCTQVLASTARSREIVKPVMVPSVAMEQLHKTQQKTAILFGPERTGLTNDDVAIADAIITIPTSPSLASLNIGQSVVVLAYQWFVLHHEELNSGTTGPLASPLVHKSELATKEELQVFFDHLERALNSSGFWKVPEKKQKMWLNIRNIFTRNTLTEQEVRTLHGILSAFRERS